MKRTDAIAHLTSGVRRPEHLPVWRVIARSQRRYRLADLADSLRYHLHVWWGGMAVTLVAALAACLLQGPSVLVTTRIEPPAALPGQRAPSGPALLQAAAAAVTELDKPATRLAALRAAGWRTVFPDLAPQPDEAATALRRLDAQVRVQVCGGGMVIAAWHRDPDAARALDRALVDAVLARRPTAVVDPRAALRANRAGLAAALDAADQRAAKLSQTLTDLARDMVEALRSTDNRSVSSEVSDQGAALLAELQLKRVQMAAKYQDDFPPLVALDGEIAKLSSVIAGERKRSSVTRSAADPVFAALASERRRVGAELDGLNAQRESLRAQIDDADHRLAALPAVSPADFVPWTAGAPVLSPGPDPRLLSLPLIALVGVVGTLVLQWLLLRERHTLVTPAEVELALDLPVLRCLDGEGVSLAAVDAQILRP